MVGARRLVATTVLVLVLFTTAGAAQDGSKDAEIRDLLHVTETMPSAVEVREWLSPVFWDWYKGWLPELPDSYRATIDERLESVLSYKMDDLEDIYVAVYARHFSIEDVRRIRAAHDEDNALEIKTARNLVADDLDDAYDPWLDDFFDEAGRRIYRRLLSDSHLD